MRIEKKGVRNSYPLIQIYHEFQKDGFEIIGLSVDDNKGKWVRAIKEDSLPWTQVSSLKGWDELTDTYGVKAVPQSFLLDPTGKIIDKNLEPKALRQQLQDLLQKDLDSTVK